jgi:lysophospholipase L1-like esterase
MLVMDLPSLEGVYQTTLSSIAKEWSLFDKKEHCLLFMGDSFFDKHGFWNEFDKTFASQDAFTIGVAATTAEEWFYLYDLLLKGKNPRKLALHLGTNDIDDDGCDAEGAYARILLLLKKIRKDYPTLPIYYFGVEPNTIFDVLKKQQALNTFLKKHEKEDPNFFYLDSPAHFSKADGTADPTMFKDGLHPLDKNYRIFLNLLTNKDFFD